MFFPTYEFARGNERFCFAFLCACRGGSRNKLVPDFLSQLVCDLRCTVIAVSRISFSRTRYSFSAINKIKSRAIFILFFCSSNSHLPATAVDVCRARKTNVVAFFVTAGTLQFVEPILSPSITSGFLIRLLFLSLFRLELFLAQNWTSNCWIVSQLVYFLVQLSRCCCSCVNRSEFAELCCPVCNAK